ncbi:MAG TPA: hypothetical protein PKD70_06955 [Saprospiraceae bacterium]|nr:hypothetical protein [Saprospiraceae bacterium]HMP13600.1 hypothetical protein [Saprospiraceae bacterium]
MKAHSEQHYATLQRSLNELPQYTPTEAVWEAIAVQLDTDQVELPLRSAIQHLPSYAPPEYVWDRLVNTLSEAPTSRRTRLLRLVPWLAAASVIGLALLFALRSYQQETPEASIVIVYGQEEVLPINADWDDDETAIAWVEIQYRQQLTAFSNQTHDSLLQELYELKEAKSEVQAMLQQYGENPQIVRLIAKIERERSAVVKKMAQSI